MSLVASTPVERKIAELSEKALSAMGYEIVRVRISGSGRAKALQVMLDRIDQQMITIDDCVAATGQISALLDVHDPIEERYRLEVSSAGLDRPLTRHKDFVRNVGREAALETRTAMEESDGRRKWKGRLVNVSGDLIWLLAERDGVERCVSLKFEEVAKAKLILTQELLDSGGVESGASPS